MPAWIDFRELRLQLDFGAVLRHYAVELNLKGDQHVGFCPLPTHEGKRNSPSFSANLEKKIFQCFGCKACGNLLDFACRMDGLDPSNRRNILQTAIKLKAQFLDTDGVTARKEERKVGRPRKEPAPPPQKDFFEAPPDKPHLVNEPLDFELKDLDAGHPYLKERGFTKETALHFGLGYCSRGTLKGRLAIPLRGNDGRMIGYAGRLVDGTPSKDTPKYLLPATRERNGSVFEFKKSLFLYNGHAIESPVDDLIVVEGFTSVWWLHQNDYQQTVALMGSSASEEQLNLLLGKVKDHGRVWVLTDGDQAGVLCANRLLAELSPHRSVRWVKLEQGRQPTDCRVEELEELLPTETAPVPFSPKLSNRSIKGRLHIREITKRQAIVELAKTFPTLARLNLSHQTWESEKLDWHSKELSAGGKAAVQFVLSVWDWRKEWQSGEFHVVSALDTWDGRHRAAFTAWANDPWFG